MSKLQLNKRVAVSRGEFEQKRENLQIKEQISVIKKSIYDYENQRRMALEDLAEEKNYDLFFKVTGVIVILHVIFRFNVPGLFIALIFGGVFLGYKKYFTKEVRASKINSEFDAKIAELQLEIVKWEKTIDKSKN